MSCEERYIQLNSIFIFFVVVANVPYILLDTMLLFNHCPFLLPNGEDVQKVLEQWKEYKMGVPTYGAIILDESLDNVRIVHTQPVL